MNLETYLRNNQEGPLSEIDPLHTKLLDDVSRRLFAVGITSPKHVFPEVQMGSDTHCVGQVDICVLDMDNALYIIEGKVIRDGTVKSNRYGINKQLDKAYRFFKREFNVLAFPVGVYRHKNQSKFQYYAPPIKTCDLLHTRFKYHEPDFDPTAVHV